MLHEQASGVLGNVYGALSPIQAIKVQLMEKVDLKKRKNIPRAQGS